MKKLLLLFLPFLLLLTACPGKKDSDQARKRWKIGVSIPSATHGWSGGVVWHAYKMEEKIQKDNLGVDIIISTSSDAQDQVNRIENLMVRGVDALVVMSQEPKVIQQICEKAHEKGIYLVIVSNPLEKPVQDVFVNGDNPGFGAAAADAMGRVLNGEGSIVLMEGYSSPINTQRMEAFRRTLAAKYPKIKILDSNLAYYNMEKALALMENFLQKYPEIDGVWAGDDDALLGAIKAIQEHGRKDIKAVVGGGGSRKVVKMILDKDPLVRATVTYPPQIISHGIQAALDGLQNGKMPPAGKREILVPSEIVLPENASGYYFPESVY